MRTIIKNFLLLVLRLFVSACGREAEEEKKDYIVKVGNEAITLEDFEAEFHTVRRKYGAGYPLDKESLLKLKAAFLNQMIEERTVLVEAKRLGLLVGAQEVDAAISELRKDYADDKSFERMLIKEYINFEKWRKKIATKLLIDKVIAHSVLSQIEITTEDVDIYYNANLDYFSRDEQVKARQILLREEKAAMKARGRIRSGEEFAAVAREVSLSPDAKEGGDLGYFSRGVMPPEFDEVVFTISTGMLSEVVPSPYGYHIFLVEEKREAMDLSLDEVRGEIVDALRRDRMEEVYMGWIEDLKKRVKVEINEDALKRSVIIR